MHFAELSITNDDVIGSEMNLQVKEHINCTVIVYTSIEVISKHIIGGILEYFLIQAGIAENLDFFVLGGFCRFSDIQNVFVRGGLGNLYERNF